MVAGRSELADGHRGAQRLIAEGVDVISAGFPCQDISFAGEGAGLAGSRSGLVWNLLRTIRLVRPRYAVLENVAALLSRGLDQICGHMATVGYDTEWHCIPASAAGAPHQRDRIWIIATDAGGQQHEGGSAPFSGAIAEELSRSFAHATAMHGPEIVGSQSDGNLASLAEMADAKSQPERAGLREIEAAEQRRRRFSDSRGAPGWWAVEPAVGRVADGVPNRVDRLRGLGNAVVPQIPEIIGRAIMTAQQFGR